MAGLSGSVLSLYIAVIVAIPAATAVTVPSLTVATLVSLDSHCTVLPSGIVTPEMVMFVEAGVPPTYKVAASGVNFIEVVSVSAAQAVGLRLRHSTNVRSRDSHRRPSVVFISYTPFQKAS